MKAPSCGCCAYMEDGNDGAMICRRYPPNPRIVVEATDWCGEFKMEPYHYRVARPRRTRRSHSASPL